MREATTEFFGESRKGLTGAYTFRDGDHWAKGALSECVPLNKARSYRCRWRDSWGEGDLHLVFSQEFESFEGVWSDKNNPRSLGLRWTGAKAP